jgi:hypothetical protein
MIHSNVLITRESVIQPAGTALSADGSLQPQSHCTGTTYNTELPEEPCRGPPISVKKRNLRQEHHSVVGGAHHGA